MVTEQCTSNNIANRMLLSGSSSVNGTNVLVSLRISRLWGEEGRAVPGGLAHTQLWLCVQEASRAQRDTAALNEPLSSACRSPHGWHYHQGPPCPFLPLHKPHEIQFSRAPNVPKAQARFDLGFWSLVYLSLMEIALKKNNFPDSTLWLATGNSVKLPWINGQCYMKLITLSSLQRNVKRILTTGIAWE